ncbi:MAG TPA: hypothetical protein VLB73_04475 [Patescibacteria group bacterium]|nr:hypothetical protein [Patescibacteria group bacterium]
MAFLFFCILFFLLFFLSKAVTTHLSRFFQQTFHNQTITIHVLSILFLPGVILHELSHLLVANLLFVTTGEIEFFPEIHGNQVKMGSVAIAHTDPLRRFLIGVAPAIGGLGILLLAASFLRADLLSWQTPLLFYIVFQITNTMFSSDKDMEGGLGFGIGLVLLGLVLQLIRVPVWSALVAFVQNSAVSDFFTRLSAFLLVAIGIDMFLVLFFTGITQAFRRH